MAGYRYKTSGAPGNDPETGPGGGTTQSPSEQGRTPTEVKTPLFALNPGKNNDIIFMGYMFGTGIKISNSATEKLPEVFDG